MRTAVTPRLTVSFFSESPPQPGQPQVGGAPGCKPAALGPSLFAWHSGGHLTRWEGGWQEFLAS